MRRPSDRPPGRRARRARMYQPQPRPGHRRVRRVRRAASRRSPAAALVAAHRRGRRRRPRRRLGAAGGAATTGGRARRRSSATQPPARAVPAKPHRLDRPAVRASSSSSSARPSAAPRSRPSRSCPRGTGYVFAQNMMYRHTITVYDSKTLKLVEDHPGRGRCRQVRHQGTRRDGPGRAGGGRRDAGPALHVRLQLLHVRRRLLPRGHDVCSPSSGSTRATSTASPSTTLKIDKVIKVGAVPKYVAVTPDQKYLLVSNWCSYTLSVVDVHTSKQVKSIYLGPVPARHRRRPGVALRLRGGDGQLQHRPRWT